MDGSPLLLAAVKGGKGRIGGQVASFDHLAEEAPLPVCLNRDGHPGIFTGAWEDVVRLHPGVRIARPPPFAAVHREVDVGVAEDLEFTFDHREFDVLARSSVGRVPERSHGRECRKDSRVLVAKEVARLHRGAVGVAREV